MRTAHETRPSRPFVVASVPVLASACLLACAACGMRSGMLVAGQDGSDEEGQNGGTGAGSGTAGRSTGGHSVTGGSVVRGAGGNGGMRPNAGGSFASGGVIDFGGRSGGGAIAAGGSKGGAGGIAIAAGGRTAAGGSTGMNGRPDGSADVKADADAKSGDAAPGTPTIDPNSGYTTLTTGDITMNGYVASSAGGSGSSIALTCTPTSFCATGTVGASTTYSSWANTGFNVNQGKSGTSGSTGRLALVGSSISVTYVNKAGSTLELQLWDGSNYWCAYLPPSTVSNTATIPFSKLNTQCWNNSGAAFTSGTAITTVQLIVPGSATVATPFDYCFLGLTVQ